MNSELHATMPLNKFLSRSGICSRRKAVAAIQQKKVWVNGKCITEPGHKVSNNDMVKFDDKLIKPESKVYIIMNKPRDCVTTVADERGRKTVMDLFKNAYNVRLYPVGRLDRNTTGLLVLTNDGEFAHKLSHPKYEIEKIYNVILDRPLTQTHSTELKKGIELEDGKMILDRLWHIPGVRKNSVYVSLHSGKYRIVRRMFEHFDYKIEKLDRVCYAGLTKQGLKSGAWRVLTQQEISALTKAVV